MTEFLQKLIVHFRIYHASHDGEDDLGLPGFHLGLQVMARHPEWGMAALREMEQISEESDVIVDAMVKKVPISQVDAG